MHPRHRFAHNLRQARLRGGISQAELAARCELHRTEISLLERGGREPRLGTIVKLAGALSIDSAALLEGIAWQPPATGAGRFQLSDPA